MTAKKICAFVFLIFCTFVPAQQTKNFRLIKQKYEQLEANIRQKCSEDTLKVASQQAKNEMLLYCSKEIKKMKAARNQENIVELSRIKKEGTGNYIQAPEADTSDQKGDSRPEYPGGNAAFQNEISENFYFDDVQGNGIQKCIVVLTIEKDGSISNVRAEGENNSYNRQAEIAVYLTTKKWNPARSGGVPISYEMKIPLTMTFQ